jgi:hypothetical protein
MSECCFGVEQRADGSIVVAAQTDADTSVEQFAPGRAESESAAVVQFVRKRSRAPRVCVAATGERSLGLALALGELPEAEVILIRPAALPRRSEPAASSSPEDVALALARYARRAA